jgi:uncharacterized protein (DUF433 family)
MVLPLKNDPLPLWTDQDGVIRVWGTRVTMDTVVGAFQQGADAREIVERYPSLSLADVHGVISYYLRHRTEVEEYLRERKRQAEEVQRQNEARFDPQGLREKLLARKHAG